MSCFLSLPWPVQALVGLIALIVLAAACGFFLALLVDPLDVEGVLDEQRQERE